MREGREHVGSYGFRGDDGPYRRAPGAYRVACLGGSTTYSAGVPDDATYPVRLAEVLAPRLAPRQVDVLNAGVPGYGTAESFPNLCLKVLDRDPDVVVVYHAINDYRLRTVAGFDLGYRHFRRVWVEEELEPSGVARALSPLAIGRLLRRTCARERRGLYGWVEREDADGLRREEVTADSLLAFERNLRAIVAVADGRGITPVLATQAFSRRVASRPHERAPFEEHNDVTRAVARDTGAVLVDVAAVMPDRGTFLPGDPVHLSDLGCRILAGRVAEGLREAGVLGRSAPAGPTQAPLGTGELAAPSVLRPDERAALADARVLRPCPYLLYDLAPGTDLPGTLGPHDAAGFRGAGPPPAARAEGTRIVLVGGASAYGLGVVEEGATARRLERRLRAAGRAVEVIAAGVPGYTTVESLAALHLRVLPLRPDVVVMAHDVEDGLAMAAPGFRGDYAHHRKPFRAEEPAGLSALLGERAGREGVDPIGCGAPLRALRPAAARPDGGGLERPAGPWAMARNLRTMVDLAHAAGARVLLLRAGHAPDAAPGIARTVAAWSDAVSAVAAATDAEVVEAPAGASADFLPGGWLPDARGHDERAKVLAAALR